MHEGANHRTTLCCLSESSSFETTHLKHFTHKVTTKTFPSKRWSLISACLENLKFSFIHATVIISDRGGQATPLCGMDSFASFLRKSSGHDHPWLFSSTTLWQHQNTVLALIPLPRRKIELIEKQIRRWSDDIRRRRSKTGFRSDASAIYLQTAIVFCTASLFTEYYWSTEMFQNAMEHLSNVPNCRWVCQSARSSLAPLSANGRTQTLPLKFDEGKWIIPIRISPFNSHGWA